MEYTCDDFEEISFSFLRQNCLDFGFSLKLAIIIRSEILRTEDKIGRSPARIIIPTPAMVAFHAEAVNKVYLPKGRAMISGSSALCE